MVTKSPWDRGHLVTIGGRSVLVSQPHVVHYGHLGMEMAMALAAARTTGSAAYFIHPKQDSVAGGALFELKSDEVDIIEPGSLARLALKSGFRLAEARGRLHESTAVARLSIEYELSQELRRHLVGPPLPQEVRNGVKWARGRMLNDRHASLDERKNQPPYLRRRLLRQPVRVFLPDEVTVRAEQEAMRCGIDPAAKIVTLHVRESGYNLGREAQDKGGANLRDDRSRNARIENHFDAVDHLVSLGYLVVRIGDKTMTPVKRRGVVDLATSPFRTDLVEVYCLRNSAFIVCGESGPMTVSYVTNTPMVNVNCTDPISSYALRPDSLFILKKVYDRSKGRPLELRELLEKPYHVHLRNLRKFSYAENTSDEIVAAVSEMVEWLNGYRDESTAQQEFRTLATDKATALRYSTGYIRKWGTDNGFLGDGRLGRTYAETYL